VRSNNEAATHIQNDTYGEMILALIPIFFDERFCHLRTLQNEKLVEDLALRCAETISEPDAGLWELRNGWQDHSFTNLMCWAGLDRVATLRGLGFFQSISFDVVQARERAANAVRAAVREGSVRNGATDASFNAALLQLSVLRFQDPSLCEKTGQAIHQTLRFSEEGVGKHFLYRYRREDDFGVPHSAFLFCSFWWIQYLVREGRKAEAKEALEEVLLSANAVGLLAEHYDPALKKQLGNFPQAYSHVGVLLAAFGVSRPWSEVL
jgi:GH15 family glucan-1,4-alpha-glucosidase